MLYIILMLISHFILFLVGALVARTCAVGVDIPSDALKNTLQSILRQHFNGSVRGFAEACGISQQMLTNERKVKIRYALRTAIHAGADGPSSLKKFARQLGMYYSTILQHFPT